MHRSAADHIRSTRSDKQAPPRVPAQGWAHVEQQTALSVLADLPQFERKLLELAFYSCYTRQEIAARLNLTLDVVTAHTKGALSQATAFVAAGIDTPAAQRSYSTVRTSPRAALIFQVGRSSRTPANVAPELRRRDRWLCRSAASG